MQVTVEYPTATEMIKRYPDLSAQELAKLWLEKLGVSDDATNVLLGPCSNEIRLRRRGQVRSEERKVLGHLPPREGEPVDQASLKTFLDRSLEIRPGEWVLMGDATTADWEARKAFLNERLLGIRKSVERCDMAIDTLKHYQVDTLRDVPIDELPEIIDIDL